MAQNFGIESHGKHAHATLRAVSRYLVVIDSEGEKRARLFDAQRQQVAEIDAATEEVVVMTRGLVPQASATDAEWDEVLGNHSVEERKNAAVYTLDV